MISEEENFKPFETMFNNLAIGEHFIDPFSNRIYLKTYRVLDETIIEERNAVDIETGEFKFFYKHSIICPIVYQSDENEIRYFANKEAYTRYCKYQEIIEKQRGDRHISKIFISQPMNGKTTEEIIEERRAIIDKIEKCFPDKSYEILDSVLINNAPCNCNESVYMLGKSISILAKAELVYFMDGWENARGCRVEHDICKAYCIPIINELFEK